MDLGLKGKNVLVLAASKGIGRAIAEEFANEGANVMISSRSEDNLKAASSDIETLSNSKVLYKTCDVMKKEDITSLIDSTIKAFGSVDILINNAGGPPAGTFDEFEDEQWQQAFEQNLLSYVRSIRAVLPSMREKKWGRIVNVASSSFKQPIDGLLLSNVMRTGVMGLAKTLATELGPDNILINTIGPGRIATDRVAELDEIAAKTSGVMTEEIVRDREALIPLGRYGNPEEFAKHVVFLCSEANTYVTGQAYLIDGGMVKSF
ncbi:3-oxoacyl-ACP reductase [Lottiidibacillus patelloidae]|uniref:3-oxoacyl-ACP reductase n=1 Tax=Lottiidibacillus patelloidae TaxID=2670334 RepID=A0A263BWW9_9BACI|nr:SDR family oxidoreductase [Lottiidibacillus patelloidae]OZM58215.1 3-oxoacyl-ACP reductase [Lottiidibacillus patelloidae]